MAETRHLETLMERLKPLTRNESIAEAELQTLKEQVRNEFDRWESYVENHYTSDGYNGNGATTSALWLVGFTISAADFCFFPWLARFVRFGFPLTSERYPKYVATYHQLIHQPTNRPTDRSGALCD
jgi:glutathione S-transferase